MTNKQWYMMLTCIMLVLSGTVRYADMSRNEYLTVAGWKFYYKYVRGYTNFNVTDRIVDKNGNTIIEDLILYPHKLPGTITVDNWDDLIKLETDRYFISRSAGGVYAGAWIRRKSDGQGMYYLTTHTFYKESYRTHEKHLQLYGFAVRLKPWED